ncbi:MAG: Clp protease [Candidatus Omnitrophota bacterium]|nr:MAG: Clp protease [Candidatus Omnitrophota bacterium]
MKAIFLDRDGVINKYPGDGKYVTSWKEFHFLPKAKSALRKLHENDFKIFVVSNQAGVNKGLLSRQALDDITERMLNEIKKSKGEIKGVYYCTHRQEDNCSCRKPKAGLILGAQKKYHIDLKKTYFIGDTIRDVQTAKAAGCKAILLLSGKEKISNRKNWPLKPDHIFPSLYDSIEFILKKK